MKRKPDYSRLKDLASVSTAYCELYGIPYEVSEAGDVTWSYAGGRKSITVYNARSPLTTWCHSYAEIHRKRPFPDDVIITKQTALTLLEKMELLIEEKQKELKEN